MPNSLKARYLEDNSNKNDNNGRLPLVKIDEGLKGAVVNKKPATGKLLLVSKKLIKDELLPGSLEVRSFEDSSNQDDNDVRLLPVRVGKKSKTVTANGKPASSKLLLASTKLVLEIEQDVRAKKVFTLKMS